MRKSTYTLALLAGLLMSGSAGAWAKGAPRMRVHSSRHLQAAKAEKTPKAPKGPKTPKKQMDGEFAKRILTKRGQKKAQ